MIFINSSPKDALKIFQPFLPIFVPVGIGYLLGVAEREGYNFDFIDEQIEKDVLKGIKKYVKKTENPYIFAFSVLTAAFKSSLILAKKLKELYPDSVIIFGGIHPTACPDEVLGYEQVDLVVRGEAEEIIIELYKKIKKFGDYKSLSGLSYRENGKIIHNPCNEIVSKLDELSSFPYHKFADKKKYDLGFILSSRGCPYNCIFCSNRVATKKNYRYRSAESVIEELDMLYHKYNQRYILFLDDNFLVNKDRIFKLTSGIKKRGLHEKMTFGFQARGDNTSEDMLRELYSAGFKGIFFGIETASNRLLNIIKKGETIEEIIDAVKLAKKIGYHVSATFIYALPTEHREERVMSLKLSKELNLDMVRYNNATPYPGTELYAMAKQENRLNVVGVYENFNSVGTFVESPFKPIAFSYLPDNTKESEIRKDILFSYLSFYFNFHRLKSIFFKPNLGPGWFNPGEKLLDFLKKLPALILLGVMLVIKYGDLFFSSLFQINTKITRKEFFSLFLDFFKNRNKKKP